MFAKSTWVEIEKIKYGDEFLMLVVLREPFPDLALSDSLPGSEWNEPRT